MSNPYLAESAKNLADAFRMASPDMLHAIFEIMRLLLADGAPVSSERLSASLQIPNYEATTILNHLRPRGGEFDPDGNIVGFGLTLVPTPHQYEVKDRQFYVWCAAEAIIFPTIFEHTANIESVDPISGEKIRLTVTPQDVKNIEPDTAVVSERIGVAGDMDNVRGTGCYYGHLFTSSKTASEYVALHEGVKLAVVSVEDVFQIGQILLKQEPLQSV